MWVPNPLSCQVDGPAGAGLVVSSIIEIDKEKKILEVYAQKSKASPEQLWKESNGVDYILEYSLNEEEPYKA